MKILTLIFTGAVLWGTTGPAWGGYRDMKKDLDNYAPPPLLQSLPSPPSSLPVPGAFEAEIATIRNLQETWEKAAVQTVKTIGNNPIPPATIDAAGDAVRTAGLLQPRFSLETVQALIVLRNRSVRAAGQRFRAALEGLGQVTQLDEILRQYSAFTDAVKTGVGPMQGMDSIRMRFPFPGVTALKGQVAEKNVEAEKASLDLVRRDTIARGSKAYWNLQYTLRARRITRDMLERLDHLDSVATTRYGAGKTSYQDVARIRIGREKLAEQLATLNEQRVNVETELLTLMDLPPGTPIGSPEIAVADASLLPLAELYPLALQNRQELRRMRAMVGKMERMVEMAETMIQPAYSQNYSLATETTLLQGAVSMQPAFGSTISPTRGKGLPKNAWFGTQDAYLQETRRKLDALRDDLADAEARTQSMVRMAWFDLDRARRERSLFQKRLLALAQTSLEVSTKGYESGSVTFADVIAAYTGWLDINLAGERRNSDLGIARAELERRVGAPLP